MIITNKATDYDRTGQNYSGYRKSDPRIAEYVSRALGNAKTILNVGAGAGSYEPENKYVAAVEPSFVMRSQRHLNNRVPAIIGKAESLPFDDNSFDASMAMLTVHHWPDPEKGLNEMKRVSKSRIVIMTYDPDELDKFWNVNYFPEVVEIEKARYPKSELLQNILGNTCEIISVPIPFDCTDGFQEAFYGRPEAFLNKEVRNSQSAWKFLPEGAEEEIVNRLESELNSGEWDRKYGHYRSEPFFHGALKLIVSSV
ncbi:MAG: class I SAM-dependent methyltransferase [Bacteroidetes bacterium]|nr:class I SAM-dependent methyltransferase [Bacteroidota bacterium]